MSSGKIHILYVDDEENNLISFKATFRIYYEIKTAISAETALEELKQDPEICIIICDQKMPVKTGVEFLSDIRHLYPDPVKILMTGFTDIEAAVDAINLADVYRYLKKPWKEEAVLAAVSESYEHYKTLQKSKTTNTVTAGANAIPLIHTDTTDESAGRRFVNGRIKISEKVNGVLNIRKQAKEFAKLLTSLSFEEGMMVGLFGRWGRGKTFFWKMLLKNFNHDRDKPFYTVEFHAWKYQDTPACWAYLYENLARTYLGQPEQLFSKEYPGYLYRLFQLNLCRKGILPLLKAILIVLVGIGAFLTLALLPAFKTEFPDVLTWTIGFPATVLFTLYSLIKYIKKEYSSLAKDIFLNYTQKYSIKEYLGTQAEIQRETIQLLKVWIKKKDLQKKRVLIFVDDIDRCKEAKIIEIIDALRVMLDNVDISKRVVVLTAIDERVLKSVIANKYHDMLAKDLQIPGQLQGLDNLVREYMDKLFIAGIKLNNISEEGRKEILQSLTTGKIKKRDEQLIRVSDSFFVKNATQFIPLEEAVRNQFSIDETFEEEAEDAEDTDTEFADPREFDLSEDEYEKLSAVVEVYEGATPRSIRILYYRYLLAKKFLQQSLILNPELKKEWYKKTFDQSILPFLLVEYSLNPKSNLEQFTVVARSEEFFEIRLLNDTFSARRNTWAELLKIVEMVIPY